MMRLILAGYLLVGASLGANAQESVPNFTGRWSGKLEVIVIDRTTGKVGQVQDGHHHLGPHEARWPPVLGHCRVRQDEDQTDRARFLFQLRHADRRLRRGRVPPPHGDLGKSDGDLRHR